MKDRNRLLKSISQQLYTNKLDNFNEMDKFLESPSVLTLNHKEMENLNRSVMSKESDLIIRNLSIKKSLK